MRVADELLKKVTLNLYHRDVEWLQNHYGYGWTEVVRRMVRAAKKEKQGL